MFFKILVLAKLNTHQYKQANYSVELRLLFMYRKVILKIYTNIKTLSFVNNYPVINRTPFTHHRKKVCFEN